TGAAAPLNRFFAAFARADPHGFFNRADEDLSVADASGLGAFLDRVEHVVNELVRHDDLDLHLRNEVDDVRRPAVDLFLAARAAKALHLGDRHALDAHFGEGIFDFVELERLDDRFDLLHLRRLETRAPSDTA